MGIKKLLAESLSLYKNNFGYMVKFAFINLIPAILAIMFFFVSLSTTLFLKMNNSLAETIIIGLIFATLYVAVVIIAIWINISLIKAISNCYLQIKEKIWATFKQTRKLILRSLGTSILSSLYILWPLLVVMPAYAILSFVLKTIGIETKLFTLIFFILGLVSLIYVIYNFFRIIFALYETIIKEKKILESIRVSKQITKNKWGYVFLRILLPIIIFWLLGFVINALIGFIGTIGVITDLPRLYVFFLTIIPSIIINIIIIPLFVIPIVILFHSLENKKPIENELKFNNNPNPEQNLPNSL